MHWMFWIILPLTGLTLGWTIRWLYAKFQLTSSEQRAERVKQDAIKEAEAKRKEILLEAKEKVIQERNQQEKETRERRAELQRLERRVVQKEDALDKKVAQIERTEQLLADKEKGCHERENALLREEERYRAELERISGLSAEDAKTLIIKDMESEARRDAQSLINKIETEANLAGEKKARDILVATIQRFASEVTSDVTVATVNLPNDEMKGRIIGREGRNIRTLETLTGVDIIIDDTPEAVVISCFDPVTREIAKVALDRLIQDGRIH
ncbi:MAG: Rnase Y domain-containing protein, partial [Treponema sp.]|nr:Rnase Y domain-containing protein [Treponema sp.]